MQGFIFYFSGHNISTLTKISSGHIKFRTASNTVNMIRSQIRKMETMPELSQQDYVYIHECHIFQNPHVFKYKHELSDNFGETMVSVDLPVVSPMDTKPQISENTENLKSFITSEPNYIIQINMRHPVSTFYSACCVPPRNS